MERERVMERKKALILFSFLFWWWNTGTGTHTFSFFFVVFSFQSTRCVVGFTTSASSGGPPQSSAESQKILAEIRDKATKEKEQFYAEREKKIEAKKKQAL